MSEVQKNLEKEKLQSMGLLDHFEDLRWCLVRCLIAFLIVLPIGIYFSDDFIVFSKSLSKVAYFTALGPAEPFIQKILVGVYLAVFMAFPYILSQLWNFISPGLYVKERNLACYSLTISYLLFSCGAFFGLTIVVPIALDYFLLFSGESIIYQPHLKEVISFILKVSIGMGIAAQLPVAIIVLYSMGIVSVKMLTKNRGLVLIGILILSAFLTPPDVISLILLALPLYICYELSVLFCRVMDKSVGDILHKKRSRMMIVAIAFLVLFLGLGIVSQIYRGAIRNQLHSWIDQVIVYYSGEQSSLDYSLRSSQGRLAILKKWKMLDVNKRQIITKEMKALWKDNKLNSHEKFYFFKVISDFGLRRDKGKVNVKIALASNMVNYDFEMLYYLKAVIKDSTTINSEIYHLYFGNQPQYLSYSKGKNLAPNIQINDIKKLFPQLSQWQKENKLITISLILSPIKQFEWLKILESEPFSLNHSP